MPKRKKSRAPKKNKNDATAPHPDEAPTPAKKIATVSSTSQLEEDQISSCTSLPCGTESQSEAPSSPPDFSCTCCNFSADTRSMLDEHMQQHKLRCPWCPFSSLSHLEVIHHCKFKHDKATEMDTVPCLACVFCSFMTFITECLETHTALKHPDKPTKYIPKMISKQVGAEVRREDALFYQTLSNESDRTFFMKIEDGSHSGAKANPIIIDAAVEVSKDIKHEANSGSTSELSVKAAEQSVDSIKKQMLVRYIFSDIEASKDLKVESGVADKQIEVRVAETPHVVVKLESLYCLTCSYSNVSIHEVKCHTICQHPVGAAAATYNLKGESVSMGDTTFFCVRESCTFSSADYSSYQKHLVDCCAFQKTLTVLEKERLKTTIMYILDCQKKYNLNVTDGFFDLTLSYLGVALPADQVVAETSCKLGSQISLPSCNENVNKLSVALSHYSSPPVSTFSYILPHNQHSSPAGMSSNPQPESIQAPYSNYIGAAQQLQCADVSNVQTTRNVLEDNRGQYMNIRDTFNLSSIPSFLPLNSSCVPSDVSINSSYVPSNVPIHSSTVSSNVPLNSSSVSLNIQTNSSNVPSNVLMNSSNVPSNVPIHSSSISNVPSNSNNVTSNVPSNSSNVPSNVPIISRNVISNTPIHSIVPGNGSLQQTHQFPVNNISNFLFEQIGNGNQQPATFSTAHLKPGTTSSVHDFHLGTNLASLGGQPLPGILINSGQSHLKTSSPIPSSLASNFVAHMNHGTSNILQNIPLSSNPVSPAGQQQPRFFINPGQSHCVTNRHHQTSSTSNTAANINTGNLSSPNHSSLIGNSTSLAGQLQSVNLAAVNQSHFQTGSPHTSQQSFLPVTEGEVFSNAVITGHLNQFGAGNLNYTSTAGQPNIAGMNQVTVGNIYQTSRISQSNTTANRIVSGQQCGIFTTADISQNTAGNVNRMSPASQLNTTRSMSVFGQQSGTLTTAGLNQSTTGNINHTFPASQLNTIEGRAVFGQQPGSLMTAGLNQGGLCHTSGQYISTAGTAVYAQAGQSGVLTTTSHKQGTTGNLNYTSPASQPVALLGYRQQPGNHTIVSLNQGMTRSLNQTPPAHVTNPMVGQENYQKQQGNINPIGLETSTQQDISNSNTILVFDMSGADSRLRDLARGNQTQLPLTSFHPTKSLNNQNRGIIQDVPVVDPAGKSAGVGSQSVSNDMLRSQSTVRCNSVDKSSGSQFSHSSAGLSNQFSGGSESDSSYFDLKAAVGSDSYRTMRGGLPEQPSCVQVVPSLSSSSWMPSSETGSAHPSHLNQGFHALKTVSAQKGSRMTTSPQQANSLCPVIISSLPPSIRHQSPAARRTYTRPRGAPLTGARPRGSSLAAQSPQSDITRRRQVTRGRGQAKTPRLLSGSTRIPHNSVIYDDDDVIVTSGFSPEDKQKSNQHQSSPADCRLPITQPQRTGVASSGNNHHGRQISKTQARVTVSSGQAHHLCQSRKRVDVGRHFENLACVMNTSASADDMDITPEDDVEILCVVAGEAKSGPVQGKGLEMSKKARPTDNQLVTRSQDNSVDWNEKDNFSIGLNDAFNDIVNSSVRLSCRPPRNSHPSIKHTVPPRKEPKEGFISCKHQPLVKPPAYSEQKETANKMSTFHHPSPKSTQIRAGLRQTAPAGLSLSAPSSKQMQQRPPHSTQLQQIVPPKTSSSITSSSKPSVHTQQQMSVIVLDEDCSTPSRETNKNSSLNNRPHQDVIVLDADTCVEKIENSSRNKELPQDVIVLDADSSEHLQQTETHNFRTTKPPECVIILDPDPSAKFVEKEKNSSIVKGHSQAVSNTTVTRPSYSLPMAKSNKTMLPQSANQNLNKTKIYTPKVQPLQPLSSASRGALFRTRVPANHEQHSFADFNRKSPAIRSTLWIPRAALASPVSASHPNTHPDNTTTQKGPQPTFSDTNFQDRNGSRTVTNTTATYELKNSSVLTTTVPVTLDAASVTRSQVSASRGGQTDVPVVPGKTTAVTPSLPDKSPSITPGSSCKDSHMAVKEELLGNNINNQSKVPENLPALLLAKFKQCANFKNISTVAQQTVVNNNTTGVCIQEHSLDSSAREAIPYSKISNAQSGEYSDKAGDIVSKFQPLPLTPKLPASSLSVIDNKTVKEATDLSESNTETLLSEMDSELIFIFDLDVNEKQAALSTVHSEQIIGFDSDVSELQLAPLSSVQNQFAEQQKMNVSSDHEIVKMNTQFLTVKNKTEVMTSTNINLSGSVSLHEKFTVSAVSGAVVSRRNSDDGHTQTVEIVNQNFSHLHNQLKDSPGPHNQLKDPPVLYNQLKESPGPHNQMKDPPVLLNQLKVSPVIHNQLKDSPVLHNQLRDSAGLHNQLKDSPVLHNQLRDSAGLHNQLKDSAGLHNQPRDSPVIRNQLRDSPVIHNQLRDSAGLHNQLKDSPVIHNQLRDSPVIHNQLRDSAGLTNQLESSQTVPKPTLLPSYIDPQAFTHEFQVTDVLEASPVSNNTPATDNQAVTTGSPADNNSQVVAKEERKSKMGVKKQEVVVEAGKFLLNKPKKQNPRKTVLNVENESENKETVITEMAIRHSDRLLKTVVKDLQNREAEIDEQLSNDSEFTIGDEDLGGDTDSEWSDSPEKNNKVKPKRVRVFVPADPTAVNVSAKGNFKCWSCWRIYTRCSFAKHHMVKKHPAGLCVIDLDRSREANSVCLLLFCPRLCKYVTNSLTAMNNHMKTCNKHLLVNQGNNYVEMNREFLDQKYMELLNLSLEKVLDSVAVKTPRNRTKAQKPQKSKAALCADKVSRPSWEIPHTMVPFLNRSGTSSVPETPFRHTAAGTSSVPVTPLRHAAADGSFVPGSSQNASSFNAHNMPAYHLNKTQKYTGYGSAPAPQRTQLSQQQRSNSCVRNNSQLPTQHSVTPTSRTAVSRDVPSNFRPQNTHSGALPLLKSPRQQMTTSNVSLPSSVSASQHLIKSCRINQSTDNEDAYVVEENGIICLE